MFGKIIDSLDGVRDHLGRIDKSLRMLADRPHDPSTTEGMGERLSSLEGRIEGVLGVVEAGIVKMDATKAAAMAADQRARGTLKRAQEYAQLVSSSEEGEGPDPFESYARAITEHVPAGDDEGVQGLPPMSNDVGQAGSDIARAKAAKRGIA